MPSPDSEVLGGGVPGEGVDAEKTAAVGGVRGVDDRVCAVVEPDPEAGSLGLDPHPVGAALDDRGRVGGDVPAGTPELDNATGVDVGRVPGAVGIRTEGQAGGGTVGDGQVALVGEVGPGAVAEVEAVL